MIGAMTSSLALAQRTASKARATMDDMSRQIATGQKVSSVKDDGAAWARASGLKSEAVGQRTVAGSVNFVRQVIDVDLMRGEIALEQRDLARQAALRATNASLSSAERTLLDTQQEDYFNPAVPTGSVFDSLGIGNSLGGNWSFSNAPVNNVLQVITSSTGATTSFQGAAALAGFNSAVRGDLSSAAAAAIALDNITRVDTPFWTDRMQYWSGVSNRLERHSAQLSANADRLNGAANSLTQADLARVSANRAQAETRQQLALDTIRTAISAYGNFANGLLGNVARTQRGVMA
jgi:flagellin